MKNNPFVQRLAVLGGLVVLCSFCFVVTLISAQLVHGEEYFLKSQRAYTDYDVVTASRGLITDRNGKVIVNNRITYALEFDSDAVSGEINDAIRRILTLLSTQEIAWHGDLPITQEPFAYTEDTAQLKTLAKYLLREKLITEKQVSKGKIPTVSAKKVFSLLRDLYEVDLTLSPEEQFDIINFRYSSAVAALSDSASFQFVDDADVDLISRIKDGKFEGVEVVKSSARVYETDAAAHLLGRVGKIYAEEYETLKEKGYAYNDIVGKSGIELAYEDYLRGRDGILITSANDDGKTTSSVYSQEPKNGGTVALTIDLDFQEQVEGALDKTIGAMCASDGIERGGAAAVVKIGTGDILALASYPTFSQSTYNADYPTLSQNKLSPYVNRATSGTYAPGSTFKPLTAIAALETGVISTKTTVNTQGVYHYYDLKLNCWIYSSTHQTHGVVDVREAIKVSCNYFFYDVGRKTGITTLARYAKRFGLGEPTGIEISERTGTMTTPEYVNSLKGHKWTDGQTLTAAIGQSYSLFTPLQLANYIATLADGGVRYPAHLLKSVKASDSPEILSAYDNTPLETIEIKDENLHAVLNGMHDLVTSGSVSQYFADCIVSAGAKTGTAQTSNRLNNGVFVAFAPFENPQIALAVVIEKGGSGGALASTAVEIINAYFSENQTSVAGENVLLR